MFDISPVQIIIVVVIALLVFGPSRLPEIGRSVGRGVREFQGVMSFGGGAPGARSASARSAATPPAAPPTATREWESEAEVLEGIVVPGDTPPSAPTALPTPFDRRDETER